MIKISRIRLSSISTREVLIWVAFSFVAIQSVSFANPLLTFPLACNALVNGRVSKNKSGIVIASNQTKGRGKYGNKWISIKTGDRYKFSSKEIQTRSFVFKFFPKKK